jgi:hypothetical protein
MEALVKISEYGGYAVQRRVNVHRLELNFKGTIPGQ